MSIIVDHIINEEKWNFQKETINRLDMDYFKCKVLTYFYNKTSLSINLAIPNYQPHFSDA